MKMRCLFLVFIFALGCAKPYLNTTPSTPAAAEQNEAAACSTSSTYTPSVLVTGTAQFFKRGLAISNSGATVNKITLSSPTTTALPIRFAEVRILDNSGQVIQCGKTNSSGALKALDGVSNLTIPTTLGSYTVQVLSRSRHTLSVPIGKTAFEFHTTVKADLYTNEVHSISQTIINPGSGSVSTSLVAYARENQSSKIAGGAFNIYNSLLTSYEYLAQNTSTSNLLCLSPKLNVYWKAGFNPAQYLYPDEDPGSLGTLSFYVRGSAQLFISGGQLGDVAIADTDHFDDAVIIHELGHHLEYSCGAMDSPGGTHYGLYRADPRLTWSEGWGNFFGAHIIKNNVAMLNPDLVGQLAGISSDGWLYYLDTTGYVDSGTNTTSGDEYIRITLNKAGNSPESVSTSNGIRYYDKVDASQFPGEGHFRETSIARSLFKITNSCASGCTNTNYFANMWRALENHAAGNGMGKSVYPFRSSARFFSRLNDSFGGSIPASIDTVLNSDEAQQREGHSAYTVSGNKIWVPYGIKLVPSGSACSLRMQPRSNSGLNTNFLSDQRYSNHFYQVDLASLPGVTEIRVTSNLEAGTAVDIDAILYKETYSFDEDCSNYASNGNCSTPTKMSSTDMARYDRTVGNGVKRIQNVNTLSPADKYLLNIRAYTTGITVASTTEYSYIITDQNGGFLCPSSTY